MEFKTVKNIRLTLKSIYDSWEHSDNETNIIDCTLYFIKIEKNLEDDILVSYQRLKVIHKNSFNSQHINLDVFIVLQKELVITQKLKLIWVWHSSILLFSLQKDNIMHKGRILYYTTKSNKNSPVTS